MKLSTATALAPLSLYALGALGPSRRLVKRAILSVARFVQLGRLTLAFPDGSSQTFQGEYEGPQVTLTFKTWGAARRALLDSDMGVAEAYMAGEIETSDLRALTDLGALNQAQMRTELNRVPLFAGLDRLRHLMRPNSKRGSKKNIAYHYDLGNAFYERWLDDTMTYSAGLYGEAATDLKTAQIVKLDRVAEELDLQPGMRVLEIGCGWGALACHLAKAHGVHVTGLTLSEEQFAAATDRAKAEGVDDQVDFRLQDYRDVAGTYDRIVSIEMFEAVGEKHWPVFFETVQQRLVQAGRAVLQVITIEEDEFHRYRKGCDFIQRYIFPGGMLPSPSVFKACAERARLSLERQEFFGESYAQTLDHWYDRFQTAWHEIEPLGFDQRFKAMWEYYLAYCAAGFRAGSIDVGHFTLVKA